MWVDLSCSGWIVLGSQYDPESEMPIEGTGFNGVVSQINMWSAVLDTNSDLPLMTASRNNLVEENIFLRWDRFQLYSGVYICRPSTAGDPQCPDGFLNYDACDVKDKGDFALCTNEMASPAARFLGFPH